MEKEKKQKLTQVSLWILLAVVVLFVIITSCIIKYKKDRLEDLSDKNDQIEDKLDQMEEENPDQLKIF